MTEANEFGKDLGLVHQVVVSGRSVGLDRTVWAILAGDEHLLAEVVELAKNSTKVSSADKTNVAKWLENMDKPCPFAEEESYFSHSSHSYYCGFFIQLHRRTFPTLFEKAKYNIETRGLCAAIECHFILCYTYSAVYSRLHRKLVKWFHYPLTGLYITFDGLVDNDDRVPRGHFLTHEEFLSNPSVAEVCLMVRRFKTLYPKGVVETATDEEASEMLGICARAMADQRQRVVDLAANAT